MKALCSSTCAIVFAASIAACAMPPTSASNAAAGPSGSEAITAARAMNAVAIGSAQADVRAALGETTVVRFDSGYEVWVYPIAEAPSAGSRPARSRSPDERAATRAEFVILFAPSGRVTKTRLRSEPSPVQ